MKRALLFPLALLLATSPAGVSQVYNFGIWSYTLDASDKATIVGYSGPGGDVTVPSSLAEKSVIQLGNGYRHPPVFGSSNTTVSSVTIPDGVTSIGPHAFYNCVNLKSVTIPNSLKSIGDYAFYNCINLGSATIPNNLESIGDYAFQNCTGLSSVTVPDNVESIGVGAFQYCTGITSLTIGNNVKSIGVGAFLECTGLTSVTIPDSVVAIGTDCFFGAPLQSINLPPHLLARVGSIGLPGPLATSLLVQGVSGKIVATVPDNYSIATKADLGIAVASATTQAIAQVQASPNNYNLYSATEYQSNYSNGITAGTSLVTANPANYGLYTSNSIMDLAMGGMMIQKQGANATVVFQTQTTTNLTQPFTNNGTPITNTIPMPGNAGFVRVKALNAAPAATPAPR